VKKEKSCKYFLLPTLAVLVISGFFLLIYSRTEIHLYVNQFHNSWADVFFKYVTHLGDGAIFALAIPLGFVKNMRWFFVVALCGLLVLVVTGISKQWLFHGFPRPSAYLEEYNLYLVPGVKMHTVNSFPSGHTTGAFALYFTMCFLLKRKWTSFGLFLLASLVGFSRIYLSQHFLIDVFTGAILGIICGYLSIAIIGSWKWSKLDLKFQELGKNDA
jgi:membrane-associated phospholipid phosphatase